MSRWHPLARRSTGVDRGGAARGGWAMPRTPLANRLQQTVATIAADGGELIDTGHIQIRQLAQELGLDLDNLLADEPNGTEDFYYFDGARYTYAQATDDLNAVYQKLHKDASAASYPTLYNSSTP